MKKILTITAAAVLGAAGIAFTASAHENEENVDQQRTQETVYERGPRFDDRRDFDREDRGGRLEREVNHLNRMIDHVRAEMRTYRADRRTRYQYEHIRDEAYRLNSMLRRGAQYYDRRRVRAQIEHMHNELHQIEEQLHVRRNGYYQWR